MKRKLSRLLHDTTYLVGHSLHEDVARLVELGVPVREGWVTGEDTFDSLILARMADENRTSYGLEDLLLALHPTVPWKEPSQSLMEAANDMGAVPAPIRKERCRLDAWASYTIAETLLPQLKKRMPLVRFTNRISGVLHRIGVVGAIVDQDAFTVMGEELERELLVLGDQLRKEAYAAGLVAFDASNDGHLRTMLYEKLRLPVLGKTPKQGLPAVDKSVLMQLDHPWAKLLMEYNKHDKQYAVNAVGLRNLIAAGGTLEGRPAGYLPFRIHSLGARTGRRASSHPNSQNWPEATRRIVRSRWPSGSIADIDYRKLEACLVGWISKDAKLFTFFHDGRGYQDVAREIFGFEVEEGTVEYRGTKSIVLGVHYNLQTPNMAKKLWLQGVRFSNDYKTHEKETGRLRSFYLRRFRGVEEYMSLREVELLSTGQVVSITGRVRHLPVPDGKDTPGYHRLLNQAINFPIQSLASDITGSAMIDTEEAILAEVGISYKDWLLMLLEERKNILTTGAKGGILRSCLKHSVLINEVHDSLVVDVSPNTRRRDLDIFRVSMVGVASLRKLCPAFTMPLKIKVKESAYWGA